MGTTYGSDRLIKKDNEGDLIVRRLSDPYNKPTNESPDHIKRLKRQSGWKRRGINLQLWEYDEMLEAQANKCLICLRESPKRPLVPDHNHKTGRIRGLLCWFCNYYIVRKGIKGDWLTRAGEYLKVDEAFTSSKHNVS